MKKKRLSLVSTILSILLVALVAVSATAQVATLSTPDPDAAATEAPTEAIDGEEAILEFVSCLRNNGLDIPDPQFGPEGVRFTDPAVMAGLDFMSRDFLDAMEACQHLLEALQPEVDPEQQAEQNEQLLAFAECMRREGIDFPDPDPVRGLTISSMRGADGELVIDPFDGDFQDAMRVCQEDLDLDVPGAPGAG
jgi:hypothetical protein